MNENKKYLVQINYKSGISIERWFTKFDVKLIDCEIISVAWDEIELSDQWPVFLGIKDIESVWVLKSEPLEQENTDEA